MNLMGWEHDDLRGREKKFTVEVKQMAKFSASEWDNKSPLGKLMESRKFLIMLLDVVLALILYFSVKYVNPSAVEDIKQVILLLQPVVVTLIYAISKEDAAEAEALARLKIAQAELDALRSGQVNASLAVGSK